MASNSVDRRRFLSCAVATVTAVEALGWSRQSGSEEGPAASPEHAPRAPIIRTLGRTGIRVPVVGMGCMNTSAPALIRRSYEIGVRLFDTAAGYSNGRNEELLGGVIQDLGARDDVVICTKINLWDRRKNLTPAQVKSAYQQMLEDCLRRLRMDHVDILLLHGAANSIESFQDDAAVESFQELKRQGKTRAIGLSGCENMARGIAAATRQAAYDVILTGFHFGMWEDRKMIQAVSKAAESGIGIIAMKTQCAFDARASQLESYRKYTRGRLLQTALLKWVLRHAFITAAIPGYSNFSQMEEDFSVAHDLDYTEEEKAFLEKKGVVYALGVCRQCRQCLPRCPRGAEVPTLMRVHRYAVGYTNFDRARFVLGQIAPERGLRQCFSCNRCAVVCPNRIDVAERIGELKLIYA